MNGERSESEKKKCWAVDEAVLFGYGIFFSLSIFFPPLVLVLRVVVEWGKRGRRRAREMKKKQERSVIFKGVKKKI
jgi:hypothetical protein